nr:N-acetylmuramidase domain-containing protein [uncultured Rhodopila sp.]
MQSGLAEPLTVDGLERAAGVVSVGLPELWTAVSVEISGCGFLPDRRPRILFERHEFRRRTQGRFERHPFMSSLGPLPIVRYFFALGGPSLLFLLLISLSARVNPENMQKGLLDNSGISLLAIEVVLLSAASLGSCFANLQKRQSYISAGTYDPRHQGSYWTRWVTGVISGILLSQIRSSMLFAAGGDNQAKELSATLSQPALALVGGYSADLVTKVINRVISAIESLPGAPPRAAP